MLNFFKKNTLEDKFTGCLIGTAVGDALGMPLEGYKYKKIKEEYGKVNEFIKPKKSHPCGHLEKGEYTDDTQLTLIIAKSLIDNKGYNELDLRNEFIEWYNLQKKDRHECRFPGAATINSIKNMEKGKKWEDAGIKSAGCGSAMRSSPIGLFYNNEKSIKDFSAHSSIGTHLAYSAIAGSVALAYATNHLVNKNYLSPNKLLNKVSKVTKEFSEGFSSRILKVKDYLSNPNEEEAIKGIGNGGWVNESVPLAFYYFLRSPKEFEKSVSGAANAGGDTDSIAAMTGALSGAYNGINAIPTKFISNLENGNKGKDYIINLGKELYKNRIK